MPEHAEDQQTTSTEGAHHRAEALGLLGDIRPPAGTAEAIASAHVHAMLAMADAQNDITRLLSMTTRELNASNMFKLAETLEDDHPLRTVIHNGLLQHMTRNGGLRTDVMLAVRIKDLGLEVKAGDDILLSNSDGSLSHSVLVIDPENDEWLLLTRDEEGADNTHVDSPRIHALFEEDINTLSVTIKENPVI